MRLWNVISDVLKGYRIVKAQIVNCKLPLAIPWR